MKKKNFLLSLLLATMMCVSSTMSAQVTIGSAKPPGEFSLLYLDNSNRIANDQLPLGLHLPRLDNDARNELTSVIMEAPNLAVGLMIYNTTNNCVEFWNSSQWVSLCASDKSTTPDIFGVWLFNDVTISLNEELSQEQHDCIINHYGSAEEALRLAEELVTESHIGVIFYYDEVSMWSGVIMDDGELFKQWKGTWHWTDETETIMEICVYELWGSERNCIDAGMEFFLLEVLNNKLYLTVVEIPLDGNCDIYVTIKYEFIPFSLPSNTNVTPSSSVRSLQQRSAPSRMHLPFIGK